MRTYQNYPYQTVAIWYFFDAMISVAEALVRVRPKRTILSATIGSLIS